MKNRILSFLMVVCILQTLILALPIDTSAAATSGSCGEGVTWTIDRNQVLTIKGNGKIDDYAYCQPWAGIKKVKIEDGVKSIGKAVFREAPYLTSVEIGDDVTVIGKEAFKNCHKLESVKLGDNVTEIGDDAFLFCEKLTNVEFPDSLEKIGYRAFMCSGLKSLEIPDSVTTIGISAFQTCENLKSIEIPDSVTEMSYGAFSHCTNVTSVKIGDGITSIKDEAFYGCTGLTDIEFGKNVKFIYDYAFYECDSLENVYYGGSKSDWEKIYIAEENSCLTNAKIYYAEESVQKPATSKDEILVMLDGNYIEFDVPPQIINGRTMVPVRAIFEAMGASVTWEQSTSSAISRKGETTVIMKLNSLYMDINGVMNEMDVSPVIIDGRTLAPARYVAEAFGADVQWDSENNTVIITTK